MCGRALMRLEANEGAEGLGLSFEVGSGCCQGGQTWGWAAIAKGAWVRSVATRALLVGKGAEGLTAQEGAGRGTAGPTGKASPRVDKRWPRARHGNERKCEAVCHVLPEPPLLVR
jgi:hypothetical protein